MKDKTAERLITSINWLTGVLVIGFFVSLLVVGALSDRIEGAADKIGNVIQQTYRSVNLEGIETKLQDLKKSVDESNRISYAEALNLQKQDLLKKVYEDPLGAIDQWPSYQKYQYKQEILDNISNGLIWRDLNFVFEKTNLKNVLSFMEKNGRKKEFCFKCANSFSAEINIEIAQQIKNELYFKEFLRVAIKEAKRKNIKPNSLIESSEKYEIDFLERMLKEKK